MEIIEILQIVLYVAGIITFLALSLVLFRIFKILGPILEILSIYNKLKNILGVYSQIPDIIKNKAKDFIKKK